MATRCYSPVGGERMRVTRLDNCGRPVFGDCSQVVSDGFVEVSVTANIDEGTEINVANAAGRTCVRRPARPQLLGYTVEIQFCRVDPAILEIMTGQSPVLDGDGDEVGVRISSGEQNVSGFALEIWSDVPGAECGEEAEGSFQYLLFPFFQAGIIGDFTIGNDAVNFTVSNAATRDGAGWGVGPYNVVLDADGNPSGLLQPIGSQDHMHVQYTEVEPPEASCGCQALAEPEIAIDSVTPTGLDVELEVSGTAPSESEMGEFTVDWGDGSAAETFEIPESGGPGWSQVVNHTYDVADEYTITVYYKGKSTSTTVDLSS